MNRLYNEYGAMNDDGRKISQKIHEALAPILNELTQAYYDWRDIEGVIQSTVSCAVNEKILLRATALRTAKLKAQKESFFEDG